MVEFDVEGSRALYVRGELKPDALTFGERRGVIVLSAAESQGGAMDESILAAVIRPDEAKASRVAENFTVPRIRRPP